jgi:hypothetical protein
MTNVKLGLVAFRVTVHQHQSTPRWVQLIEYTLFARKVTSECMKYKKLLIVIERRKTRLI